MVEYADAFTPAPEPTAEELALYEQDPDAALDAYANRIGDAACERFGLRARCNAFTRAQLKALRARWTAEDMEKK